jgi:hypothetical protein
LNLKRKTALVREDNFMPFGGVVNRHLNTLMELQEYLLISWVGYEVSEKVLEPKFYTQLLVLALKLHFKFSLLNSLEKITLRAICNILMHKWDDVFKSEELIFLSPTEVARKMNTGSITFMHCKSMNILLAQKVWESNKRKDLTFVQKGTIVHFLVPFKEMDFENKINIWQVQITLESKTQFNGLLEGLCFIANNTVDINDPFGDI